MKILLLEDEIDYQETISDYLQSLDYKVDSYENGREALEAIYENSYHLLLLDIRVPEVSGYEIVKKIRAEGNDIPVIFLTSLTDINNLSIGYELGCNDYIRKPFAIQELKYRVEQTLKLFYFHTNKELVKLKYGYAYDIKNEQILYDNKVVLLTQKEQKVFDYLIRHKDEYVQTKVLWEDVWDYKMVTEADIRMCIKKIRAKTKYELIESHKGMGYKVDSKK
jgi:DNA-binding response OmpR family regulator